MLRCRKMLPASRSSISRLSLLLVLACIATVLLKADIVPVLILCGTLGGLTTLRKAPRGPQRGDKA